MAASGAAANSKPPAKEMEESTPFKLFVGQVSAATASLSIFCPSPLAPRTRVSFPSSPHRHGGKLRRGAGGRADVFVGSGTARTRSDHSTGRSARGPTALSPHRPVYLYASLCKLCAALGQVPMHMTAEQLRPNFDPFGNVEEVTIIYDKTTNLSKGPRSSHTAHPSTHKPSAFFSGHSPAGNRGSFLAAARSTPPPPPPNRRSLRGLLSPRRLRLRHLLHRGIRARRHRLPLGEMRAGERSPAARHWEHACMLSPARRAPCEGGDAPSATHRAPCSPPRPPILSSPPPLP